MGINLLNGSGLRILGKRRVEELILIARTLDELPKRHEKGLLRVALAGEHSLLEVIIERDDIRGKTYDKAIVKISQVRNEELANGSKNADSREALLRSYRNMLYHDLRIAARFAQTNNLSDEEKLDAARAARTQLKLVKKSYSYVSPQIDEDEEKVHRRIKDLKKVINMLEAKFKADPALQQQAV